MADIRVSPEERIAVPVSRVGEWGLWLLLLAVLVVNVPAFACMGLDPDALQWDLCTRAVLQGRVLYRDAAENNLPGMLWPLALIRSLFGWRSEVLRLADLLIVLAIIWQLMCLLPSFAPQAPRLALGVALLVFYFSTSEWCHCQRDVWMLLPTLVALSLRRRQVARLSNPAGASGIVVAGFIEGLLWAAAFWIKPFVAVPALLCWLLSARLAWLSPDSRGWKLALDGAAVLAGGITAGVAGSAWLWATGAWPAFVEVMFEWNREYVGFDVTEGHYWLCLAGFAVRFFPWVFVHFLAVPVALAQIWRAMVRTRPGREAIASTLLAGLYLGWLLQSVCLQHLFDYVQVPGVLLGLTVVADWAVASAQLATRRIIAAVLVVCIVLRFPALCIDRLAVWSDCLRQGSTAALRDRLTLLPKGNWSDLDRVKAFLREQDVKNGELSCMSMPAISLYGDLGVKPATRFHFVTNFILALPRQRDVIEKELAASGQRFMVCDVEGIGMEDLQPSPAYPWSGKIVFRAGRYVVLRLSGAETPVWLATHFKR